jgi:gamma-tubulin complex component 2
MSLHDRRAASYSVNTGTNQPRASSGRADEPDISSRNSPVTVHNMDRARGSTASPKVMQREYSNGSERRTERTTITTREKVQIKSRNPVKESANAENRGNVQKFKSKKVPHVDPSSPLGRGKEKEVMSGASSLVSFTRCVESPFLS